MPKLTDLQKRGRAIDRRLKKAYPDARCSLNHGDALQLLIATILSAQCTDERVNKVTPGLFRKYPDAAAFARAKMPSLESAVRSTGFFRNKAKSIQACCAVLVEEHDGVPPDSLEALTKLAGVGRKTANVVLGNAYDVPGMVVDTHVKRISNLLGLTKQSNPDKIELDLQPLVPKKDWTGFGHRMIAHGRAICIARRPDCAACPVSDLCPYARSSASSQAD